jgi:hypothetical protein
MLGGLIDDDSKAISVKSDSDNMNIALITNILPDKSLKDAISNQ